MTKAQIKRIQIYSARNKVLREMGYEDYSTYLSSDLWQSIRIRVLTPGRLCVGGCRKYATQVHHEKYRREDLVGEDLRFLHPVCGGCHRKSEFRKKDGEKLDPEQATAKLLAPTRRRPRKKEKKGKRKPFGRVGKMTKQEKKNPAIYFRRRRDDRKLAEETLTDYQARLRLFPTKRRRSRK